MLDGAALGTLMIGLDAVRASSDWTEPSARTPRRHTSRPTTPPRHRLATALRFVADRLEGRPIGDLSPLSRAAD